MSSNWPVKKLGDLVTFLSGGTPSKSNKDYWNGEIPWISASSMLSTRYHDSDLRVTSLGSTNGTRRVPAGTVLLLVRGGALHNKIPVGITTREVTFNQDVKALIPKSGDITSYYLLAWLISSRELLLGKVENTGIGAGKLDTKILRELDVIVPPKAELLRLESFSQALDDKIILNQNINQTLEQMAQALFKSWFVDFEPVKAKIAALEAGGTQEDATLAAMTAISGKDADALVVFEREQPEQYAELKATAELFPSAMQESELGEIPEGWGVTNINNTGKVVCGKTPSKKEPKYYDGKVPFIKIPDMHGNLFILRTKEYLSEAGSNSQIKKLIPAGAICVSCIATIGVVSITTQPSHTNQQINTVIPSSSSLLYYLYFGMIGMKDYLHRLGSAGSATLNVNTSIFSAINILLPKLELLEAFHVKCAPLFKSIKSFSLQNESLTQLRDTLLPRLLSGEITLPEAEQAFSEVEHV